MNFEEAKVREARRAVVDISARFLSSQAGRWLGDGLDTPTEVARKHLSKSLWLMKDGPFFAGATIANGLEKYSTTEDRDWFYGLIASSATLDQDMAQMCAGVVSLFSKIEQPIPKEIARLCEDIFMGRITLNRPRGRRKEIWRDTAVLQAVEAVLDRFSEIRPTRNEVTSKESACSIVADVLSRFDIKLSEKSVEAIYLKGDPS